MSLKESPYPPTILPFCAILCFMEVVSAIILAIQAFSQMLHTFALSTSLRAETLSVPKPQWPEYYLPSAPSFPASVPTRCIPVHLRGLTHQARCSS